MGEIQSERVSLLIQVTAVRLRRMETKHRKGDFLLSGEFLPQIGFVSSSEKKASLFSSLLRGYNLQSNHLPVEKDRHEPENHSPRVVGTGKAVDFVGAVEDQLSRLPEVPCACIVPDVLALYMPNGIGRFHDANRVLKRPEPGSDPVEASVAHFKDTLEHDPVGEMYYFAYAATFGIVRIDQTTKQPKYDRTIPVWDTMWFGMSEALVKILADEKNVSGLLEKGILPKNTYSNASISGHKIEKILPAAITLAKKRPQDGIAMDVVYQGKGTYIDGTNDPQELAMLGVVMDRLLGNVTIPLLEMTLKKLGLD